MIWTILMLPLSGKMAGDVVVPARGFVAHLVPVPIQNIIVNTIVHGVGLILLAVPPKK